MNIIVVGNSWSIPSLEVNEPAFDQLGLTNRWEHHGITLAAQAEYIIDNNLTSNFKVIWLVGHHHRADPRADGNYLLPYEWREDDIWSEHVKTLWFKKITRMDWYKRNAALAVKAVLDSSIINNLLLIPIYRPNTLEHKWFNNHPSVWLHFLRDYVREYPDGRGHMNQKGHNVFAPLLQEEVWRRWQISLILNGETVSRLALTARSQTPLREL